MRSITDWLEFDLTKGDSSDDDPLVRPQISGGRVQPQCGHAVSSGNRFSPLEQDPESCVSEDKAEVQRFPRRRRLVLMSHGEKDPDSETDRSGATEAEDIDVEAQEFDEEVVEEIVFPGPKTRSIHEGLQSLDTVILEDVFQLRATLMQTVPKCLQGAYRSALRVALEGIKVGVEHNNVEMQSRAWKLFMLVPRMFLSRPGRGGLVPRRELEARVTLFQSGKWDVLVEMSLESSEKAASSRARRRRQDHDSVEKRARRALRLVKLGELSAGRQALEGAAVAPGDESTLRALMDPDRRPAEPREPVPRDIMDFQAEENFVLEVGWFESNVRQARRGDAAALPG